MTNARIECAGAAEYVTCPTCGAPPGTRCTFETVEGPVLSWSGHESRRAEYVEGRNIFYPEPTYVPPEIWRACQQGRHADCLPHPATCRCSIAPDPCACSCHDSPFLTNVDDLLG